MKVVTMGIVTFFGLILISSTGMGSEKVDRSDLARIERAVNKMGYGVSRKSAIVPQAITTPGLKSYSLRLIRPNGDLLDCTAYIGFSEDIYPGKYVVDVDFCRAYIGTVISNAVVD